MRSFAQLTLFLHPECKKELDNEIEELGTVFHTEQFCESDSKTQEDNMKKEREQTEEEGMKSPRNKILSLRRSPQKMTSAITKQSSPTKKDEV